MGRDSSDTRSSGAGRGRGGRTGNRFRGKSRDGRNSKSTKKPAQQEMKFGPQGQGSVRYHTYQTVKDHVLEYIQQTYKSTEDVLISLKKESWLI